MSERPATHPGPQQLADFATGRLADPDARLVADHVASCPDCRRLVEGVANGSFPELAGAGQTPPGGLTSGTLTDLAKGASATDLSHLPEGLLEHPKFRVIRELGRGGMGTVYLAEHRVMERRVAIKVIDRSLLDRPEALERFQAEVRAAARLQHPNIVTAYDAERAGDLHFLVMEYVEGVTLSDLVSRKGPLPVGHACVFARQAALGLQHAHERAMVHRDIKPQNLMLMRKNQIKILDFGLARLASERGRPGAPSEVVGFLGTPEYVSPEQANDARVADIRSDVYSLGCTLYCLLTGGPPFRSDSALKLIVAHLDREPEPVDRLRPEVPDALTAVVARMLAKDPARRYQTPAEVARALAPFCEDGSRPQESVLQLAPGAASPAGRSGVRPPKDPEPTGRPSDNRSAPASPPARATRTPPPDAPVRARRGGSTRRVWLVGAAAGFVALLLAVVAIVTGGPGQGRVVFETDDPSVTVEVRQGDRLVRVIDPSTEREVALPAGTYELALPGDRHGLEMSTARLTVQPDRRKVVRISGPAPTAAPGTPPPLAPEKPPEPTRETSDAPATPTGGPAVPNAPSPAPVVTHPAGPPPPPPPGRPAKPADTPVAAAPRPAPAAPDLPDKPSFTLTLRVTVDGTEQFLFTRAGVRHLHDNATLCPPEYWVNDVHAYTGPAVENAGSTRYLPEGVELTDVRLVKKTGRGNLEHAPCCDGTGVKITFNDDAKRGRGDYSAEFLVGGSHKLSVQARVDGCDDLYVLQDRSFLVHHHAAWPTRVVVNGIAMKDPGPARLPNSGATRHLPENVDLARGVVEKKRGRGPVTVVARDPLQFGIRIDDPDPGADEYEVVIRLPERGP